MQTLEKTVSNGLCWSVHAANYGQLVVLVMSVVTSVKPVIWRYR